MKISELSLRSGVSPASIKFYIREGLLPRGQTRAPNQADYDESHVDRLILIRTLREVGNFSIDRIRLVADALQASETADDEPSLMLNLLAEDIESAHQPPAGHEAAVVRARTEVDRLLDSLAWRVHGNSAAREELAQVLAMIRSAWIQDFPVEALLPYAQAVERITELEIPDVSRRDDSAMRRNRRGMDARWAILRLVLGERAISALRRMAHESRIQALREQGVPIAAPQPVETGSAAGGG